MRQAASLIVSHLHTLTVFCIIPTKAEIKYRAESKATVALFRIVDATLSIGYPRKAQKYSIHC